MAISITSLPLLTQVPTAGAVTEQADDALLIDYEPTFLELGPGERGDVTFIIQNIGTCSTWVGVTYTFVDAPGHSVGTVDPSYFELEPQEEREVRVVVESRAHYRQDIGYSDFSIDVLWGPDLTQGTDGEIDRDTADGTWAREFAVQDDFSGRGIDLPSLVLFILVIVALVVAAVLMLGRSRRKAPPSPGG